MPCSRLRAVALMCGVTLFVSAQAQTPLPPPRQQPGTPLPAPKPAADGKSGDAKTSQSSADQHASTKEVRLGPLDPSTAPARVFTRPVIGLALGGGAALSMSDIGVLQWLEEHHIPIDVIAGTSMGCMVSALYSTGRSPAELKTVMDDKVFASVFTFANAYSVRSYRRREDARELPSGITIGLKHRVSFRNSLLIDQGLNAFLDREFLRYDDQTDFNQLPIPLRCMATDLTAAKPVTFARGSLPDAVRASVSIPGVFKPVELGGHELVDGGILENLPTPTVQAMKADVILAVSIPIQPVGKGDLDSLIGVLTRTASVGMENFENQQRRLASVVILPDVTGFNINDYLKAPELAQRGYAAAEANKAALVPYAVSDADWQAYLAHRESLRRGPPAPVLMVKVSAPTPSATIEAQRLFARLVNQPVDTTKIEALLDQLRSDGAYDADYTIGYSTAGAPPRAQAATTDAPSSEPAKPYAKKAAPSGETPKPQGVNDTVQPATAASLADTPARPIILVTLTPKITGPPFLLLGANLTAQAGGITAASVEGIFTQQDFGSYGSELRAHVAAGYTTRIEAEYFHPLNFLAAANRDESHTFFIAPHGGLFRQPYPIFNNQTRIAERQLQTLTAGFDIGGTNQRTQELRAGLDFIHLHWDSQIGNDGQPDLTGNVQRARIAYNRDTQDRALVAQFGSRIHVEADYLFDAHSLASPQSPSPNTPSISGQFSAARRFSALAPFTRIDPLSQKGHEILVFATEGGTMFGRNVAQPFRFTLGGPLRLSASTIDQYRGTDYFLVEPALLRRIASLPAPLGQSLYVGAAYEFGQMRAPGVPTINRHDVYFGIVAETPLGVITFAPALGSNGERKFVFTLGKLF